MEGREDEDTCAEREGINRFSVVPLVPLADC